MYGQIVGQYTLGKLIEQRVRSAFSAVTTITWPEYVAGIIRRGFGYARFCLQTQEGIAYFVMQYTPDEAEKVTALAQTMRQMMPHEFLHTEIGAKPSYIKA